jgi:hypothetical protein
VRTKEIVWPRGWWHTIDGGISDDGINWSIRGYLWHWETRKRFLRKPKSGWYLMDSIHLGQNIVDRRRLAEWHRVWLETISLQEEN